MKLLTKDGLAKKPAWVREQIQPVIRKGNKYHAKKSDDNFFPELAARSFQSKLERDRARELCLLQKAGEIRNLQFQPRVFLTRAEVSYHPDFYYEEKRHDCKCKTSWHSVHEETKGVSGYPWLTNRKLWRVYGPGLLRVTVRGSRGGIKVKEEIWPTG